MLCAPSSGKLRSVDFSINSLLLTAEIEWAGNTVNDEVYALQTVSRIYPPSSHTAAHCLVVVGRLCSAYLHHEITRDNENRFEGTDVFDRVLMNYRWTQVYLSTV